MRPAWQSILSSIGPNANNVEISSRVSQHWAHADHVFVLNDMASTLKSGFKFWLGFSDDKGEQLEARISIAARNANSPEVEKAYVDGIMGLLDLPEPLRPKIEGKDFVIHLRGDEPGTPDCLRGQLISINDAIQEIDIDNIRYVLASLRETYEANSSELIKPRTIEAILNNGAQETYTARTNISTGGKGL